MTTRQLLILGCILLSLSPSIASHTGADSSQAASAGHLVRSLSIASPVEDHPRRSEEEDGHKHHQHKHHQRKFHPGKGMQRAAHYETYLKLLVDKYAPDTTKQWETVLQDSARLRSDLHKTLSALPPEVRQKWKDTLKEESSAQGQSQRAKWMATHQAFDAAVLSQDRIRIHAALNDMLKACRQHNESMTAKLSKLQKAGAAGPKSS